MIPTLMMITMTMTDDDDNDDNDDEDDDDDKNLVREKQFDAVAKTFLCCNVQGCLSLPFSIMMMMMMTNSMVIMM